MSKRIPLLANDTQDRNSRAWKKLCDYIMKVQEEKGELFSPERELGPELFSQIRALPETIAGLKSVKKILLYGSRLKRIPPEIGEMEALEFFEPYRSYNLHWFPYEITKCKNLKGSCVSTRALFGNFKNKMAFPNLNKHLVRYLGDSVKCNVCSKIMTYEQTNQVWISLCVGSDILPLLTNLCSKECEGKLPTPPTGYIQYPHKGAAD